MKILVLEAVGLHLGFLGCYGNEWVATPNLDRLAAEGVVFDQHITDQPVPRAAPPAAGYIHRATLTSLRGFADAAIVAIDATEARAAEIVWLGGPSLVPPWLLSQDMLAVYLEDDGGDEPCRAPAIGLGRLELEQFGRLQSTYAAVVTYFDAQVGSVIDRLREAGRLDSLTVAVTARFGLPLGEHGMTGIARAWLHDELVHVPLIVRLPGAEAGGLRIEALTQSPDLLATLGPHHGVDGSPSGGQSLWPLIRGETEQVRPHAIAGLRVGASEEWLLRTPERALLMPVSVPGDDPPRRLQMYVKPDDRWEVNDLSVRYEEEAAQLEQTLRAAVAVLGQA